MQVGAETSASNLKLEAGTTCIENLARVLKHSACRLSGNGMFCTCALQLCGRRWSHFSAPVTISTHPLLTVKTTVTFFQKKLQLRWQKLRIPWRKAWRRRSLAPFVKNTSVIPRSSLASTTTARNASDKLPSEQGPTTPLHVPSAERKRFCLKMTPINYPRRFSSTE